MKPKLGATAVRLIEAAVESLFDKIRQHTLGDKHPQGKRLYISYSPHLTLKGIFDSAAAEEGVRPDQDVLRTLLKISSSYIDATKEKAKAKVVQSVQAFLTDAANQGVKTDVETVLSGKLYQVMGEATRDLKRIFETESTVVRNTSLMDGIVRSNASLGIPDPTVFWVIVRDGAACSECVRLHMMPDKVTPRVYRLSEAGSGYHTKGENSPKIAGLHPHCRCCLTTLLPGYSFNGAGRVQYKSPGWDEYAAQRGLDKSEVEIGEPLQKGFKQSHIMAIMRRYGWVDKPGGGHDMLEHPTIRAKIPFQRGYVGDYDNLWAKKHFASAGLMVNRQGEVLPDPTHTFYSHYVASGHAQPVEPQVKTWNVPGTVSMPIEQLDLGGVPDYKAHAKAVAQMKAGTLQDLPHVDVMDTGEGIHSSISNHHLIQAARDAGMTHVPVKVQT